MRSIRGGRPRANIISSDHVKVTFRDILSVIAGTICGSLLFYILLIFLVYSGLIPLGNDEPQDNYKTTQTWIYAWLFIISFLSGLLAGFITRIIAPATIKPKLIITSILLVLLYFRSEEMSFKHLDISDIAGIVLLVVGCFVGGYRTNR